MLGWMVAGLLDRSFGPMCADPQLPAFAVVHTPN